MSWIFFVFVFCFCLFVCCLYFYATEIKDFFLFFVFVCLFAVYISMPLRSKIGCMLLLISLYDPGYRFCTIFSFLLMVYAIVKHHRILIEIGRKSRNYVNLLQIAKISIINTNH